VEDYMVPLTSLKKGDTGTVTAISKGSPSYRAKLLSMGVTPGTPFSVVRFAPLGDPIELEIRGFRLSLRKAESEIVMVEVSS
jgi:ferrous iron transport protein A